MKIRSVLGGLAIFPALAAATSLPVLDQHLAGPRTQVAVLVSRLDAPFYPLPMFIAMLSLAGWLLFKGVDAGGWAKRDPRAI